MIKSFEKPVRCQCRNISNNKICLKKCRTLYMVEKKLYCNNHCQYYRNVFAAKIQSLWRGFKQRRMMNVIYKRLPEELQIKILYFVKRDTYQKRYINKIRNIIELKLGNIYFDAMHNYHDRKLSYFIINNEKEVLEVSRLYNKYYKILSEEYRFLMIKIMKNLFRIVNSSENLVAMGAPQQGYNKLKNVYVQMEWLIKPNRERSVSSLI